MARLRSALGLALVFGLTTTGGVGEARAQSAEPRAEADAAASPERPTLRVGVKEAPPFAMRDADGRWVGIAVELFGQIARETPLDFTFVEVDLDVLFDDVANGRLDAGIGALSVTSERETRVDFTHPFRSSGLGIAVPPSTSFDLTSLLSFPFGRALLSLATVLLVAGLVLWGLERKRNAEEFRAGLRGVGDGFWWAAVTMTTVGYGDKSPRTAGGRAFALVFMFFSVITISGLTASIASSLTLSRLASGIEGPQDLPEARVGAVAGTTGEDYLERENIGSATFPSLDAALDALAGGRIDAVVYDALILRYSARTAYNGRMSTLPQTFDRQDYGIALPPGSALREPINRALLEALDTQEFRRTLEVYLGS